MIIAGPVPPQHHALHVLTPDANRPEKKSAKRSYGRIKLRILGKHQEYEVVSDEPLEGYPMVQE